MDPNVEKIFKSAEITVNGHNAWDIKIHDERFFNRLLLQQSLGAGESYVAGWWDCDQLDELFFRISRYQIDNHFQSLWKNVVTQLKNSMFNQQNRQKSEEVAKVHYNLGNKLFECMLGKSMAYTCGYWKNATTLDEAEFAKYDLVCKKLYLRPKDKVLEIGCGWGGLAKFMAEKYDCEVVALDIGREPARFAKAHCNGLPVTIHQCDYRDTQVYNPKNIQFDKVVSVGVLEHVGYKNYKLFLELISSVLKEDGLLLLHTIGRDVSTHRCDPWINKYIFPNGMLPSLKQLGQSFEHKFVVEDFQNFGAFYDKTLLAWHRNFNDHWPELKSNYNEPFRRMINYYLLSCAGTFRARGMQLWQFVLTPRGILNGYTSIR